MNESSSTWSSILIRTTCARRTTRRSIGSRPSWRNIPRLPRSSRGPDSRGTDAYNQALSERRAYAVRDYLIDKKDIDPRRVTAVGYGESKPTATNDRTPAGSDRRVDA